MKLKEDNTLILSELKRIKKLKKDNQLAKYLGVAASKLANWRNRGSVDIYTIKSKCPEIDANWLLNPKGPIKLLDTLVIPSFPLIAADSIKKFLSDGEDSFKRIYATLPNKIDCDFIVENVGDAMMPKYANGDMLACKIISKSDFIRPGNISVIFTDKDFITTRIEATDKDTISCTNENSAYKPFSIRKNKIIAIALVQCAITFN